MGARGCFASPPPLRASPVVPPLDDFSAAAAQLGRPVRGATRAVRRCHLSLPVVLEVAPLLPNGRPFPTLYWLSCPLAHRRIARLEAAGGVRAMDRQVAEDEAFRAELELASERYARARARCATEALPPIRAFRGGIGGAIGGTKCLHAHFAHHLADGPNPIGAAVEREVVPLDCSGPCVELDAISGETRRSAAWSEPARAEGRAVDAGGECAPR